MIKDVTGIVLTTGNIGKDCIANGFNKEIECCCDECDYLLCCIDDEWESACKVYKDHNCPRFEKRY